MASAQSVILVTGGNNGVGLYTCTLLASQANYHVIMGSRSLEKGEKALLDIQSRNPAGSISLVQLDITSDTSIAAAVKQIGEKHGRLDALINNAGICFREFSRDILRDSLETNCISPAIVTQAFAPLLKRSAEARIVYVSSALGSIAYVTDQTNWIHIQDYKAYSMSKAALNMLTAWDALEYDEFGIKVFAFCPGYVISDLAGIREMKTKQGVPTPEGSARGLLAIVDGKRDVDAGKFLHGESTGLVYSW